MKRPGVKESEVENHFCWTVEMMGGMTWKTKALGRIGFPDRFAALPGGGWLVELKRPKGPVREAQKAFAADMERMKVNYVLLTTKEEVDAWAEGKIFRL